LLTCTHKAYKAVKKKYRTFARYKDKNHPAYVTASTKAKKLIKAARRNFETKLAAKIKDDKKSFLLTCDPEPNHELVQDQQR